MTTQDNEHASALKGFPGGRAQLPRLARPKKLIEAPDRTSELEDDPAPSAEDTSGHRDPDPSTDRVVPGSGAASKDLPVDDDAFDEGGPNGSFNDYFTIDSLFGASPDRDDDGGDETTAAYAVLGLTRRASWKDVTRAHRELVAMLHPDRYVDSDESVREAAERRVRDVNEAYALIRQQRAPAPC